MQNPRDAAVAWFRNAKYGLFIHYGLYSQLGENEHAWRLQDFKRTEYEKLANTFNPEKFDAHYYADFAIACGMRYITLVTKHCDGFSLWASKATDFHSMNGPAKRDLVGEMSAACRKRGLGLFLFYEHGLEWRHPHAPAPWDWKDTRTMTVDRLTDPWYAQGKAYDLTQYVDFVSRQIAELLTGYGPVAGIWLDGIGVPLSGDFRKFRCDELYDMIRRLQPQALISYKQGLLGTEDFFAPEHRIPDPTTDSARLLGRMIARPDAPVEICTSMTPTGWCHMKKHAGEHKSAADVWEILRAARRQQANLLLNIGPLPDASINPEDEAPLRAVGERLRHEGFPE